MITIKDCSNVTIDNLLTDMIGEDVLIERCSDVHLSESIDDDVPFGNLDILEDDLPGVTFNEFIKASKHMLDETDETDEDSSDIDINEKFANLFLDKDSETDEDECMCGGMTNHECTDMKEDFAKKDIPPYVSDYFSKANERNKQKQTLLVTMVEQFKEDYSTDDYLPTLIFNKIFDIMDILAIGTHTPSKYVCDKRLANVSTIRKNMRNYVFKIITLYDPIISLTGSHGPLHTMTTIQNIISKHDVGTIATTECIRELLDKSVYRITLEQILKILVGIFGDVEGLDNSIVALNDSVLKLSNNQRLMSYHVIDQNSGRHYFDGFTEKGCIAELLSIIYPLAKRKCINKEVTKLFETLTNIQN